MASELRVNTINSRTGFGTITVSETGQDLVGITTIENLTAENTLVGAAASFTGNVSVGGVLTYEDVTNIDSVGLITARQGIEIGARPGVAASISVDGNMIVSGISTFKDIVYVADKILHDGDGNTGIRFPSADNISFETSGTERLRISDSGGESHVLISGDAAPAGTGAVLMLKNLDTTAQAASTVQFVDAGGQTISSMNGISVSDGTNEGYLKFYTRPASGSPTLALTIDSSGRVLTGTATEGHSNADDLTIATSGNTGISIRSGTSSTGNIFFSDATSSTGEYEGMIFYDHSENSMTFATSGSEKLKITSAGLVNIGGAAVSQSRTLNIGSNAEANLAIETHNDATSETANIRFYKSGNTGASPQVVETNDNIAQIQAYGYDGTDYACSAASIKFSVDGAPGSNDMPGKITFSTTADGASSPTARLTIKSDGKIGINDTTPSAYLDIAQGGIDSDVPGINIAMTGVGGGTVGPQYGIKITGGGYNNADHIYGIFIDKTAQLSQQNTAGHHKMSGTYNTLYGTQSIIQVNDTGATGTAYGLYASARGNSGSAKNKVGYGAWIESTGTNFQLCNAARLKTVAGSTLIYGIIYQHDSTEVFRISANGDVWSATNSYSSDRDLKDNIVNLSGTSLDKIKQLTPRQFNWKLDDRQVGIDSSLTAPTNTLTGLIAQEVKPILPDIVSGTDGEKDMGINYNGLTAHLVNAVKELSAENAAMRARLDALESA